VSWIRTFLISFVIQRLQLLSIFHYT